jgi:hypothetical protein
LSAGLQEERAGWGRVASIPTRDLGERKEIDGFFVEAEECFYTHTHTHTHTYTQNGVCKHFYFSHYSVCLANKYLSYSKINK